MIKVIIADDERIIRESFVEVLEDYDYIPIEASTGKRALELFEKENPSAVLLDMKLPDCDGLDIMQQMKKINRDIPVIIVTGFGDIPTAVDAIKHGAYDFIVKPPNFERLIFTLQRAIEKLELQKEIKRLNTTMETSLEGTFGKSAVMKKVIDQVQQVSKSNLSIIIQGETGTGKSFIANYIHNFSHRASKPFVKVDISTIPENLIESELFGHEKGAFTGADRKKKGFFEMADTGTIFIDEIENMSLNMQTKLLNVVEEKQIFPLGRSEPVKIDARIITATNSNIKQQVIKKEFRDDLFYRLSELIINIPPLKDRSDDVAFFAHKFLIEASTELKKQVNEIADETLRILNQYSWPGNIRELKNVVRRAVLFSGNGVLRPQDIEFMTSTDIGKELSHTLPLKELSAMAVRDIESKTIRQVLQLTKGNKTKAASILQIDYKTLLTKIKEYCINGKV